MRHKLAAIAFGIALIALFAAVPAVRADTANEKIVFTVTVLVNVPGQVLAPGKYEMKFAEDGDYKVVQISTADGARPVGLFEVIPVERSRDLSQVEVEFTQTGARERPRLNEFFYPGDKTGYQFEYRGTPRT